MSDLNVFQKLIIKLARVKKWNNKTPWLFHKLREEEHELEEAVILKKSAKEIMKEVSDVIIVLAQIAHNEAKNQNMDTALHDKITDDWIKPKKTLERHRIVKK